MLEFFESIGNTIENIFNFITSTVETFNSIVKAVSDFFAAAGAVIDVLPDPFPVIIYSALGMLLAFIIVELLRDFL